MALGKIPINLIKMIEMSKNTMTILRYFLVISLVSIANLSTAQELTANGKPNRFMPYGISEAINSAYNEINPVFSLDEKTIYFSRLNHPNNHYGDFHSQDIWYAQLQDNGSWSEAKRIDALFNNARFNSIYSITEKGKFLISGNYRKNGKYKSRGLSFVTKTENGWSLPETIKIPKVKKKDKGIVSSAYMNKDATSLFLVYSSSWLSASSNTIRYSTIKNNDKWEKPKAIKNKKIAKEFSSVESPYLSDDNLTLYFSAFKNGKRENYKNDIYRITRKNVESTDWSNPIKVSDTINSNSWENYYKRFNENNWAIFTKADVGDDADIFIVKIYEPKPYVDLKGVVKLDNKKFEGDYKIKINGEVVDSIRINKDSSTYAVRLPLGKRYELQAEALEMEAKLEVIDARYDLEYLPMERDLELSLLPFLDLSGTVTVNGELLTEPFNVLVNGQIVDSLATDTLSGTYSVKLPLGRVYNLEVQSGNYIPENVTVDVTAESKQIQINRDLLLTAISYVDITGNLINTEGNVAILTETNPKIVINGVVVDSIATIGSKYKIRLPWGQKYIFQLQADEFAPVVAVIDLINVKNYKEITQDLLANPLKKRATVTGTVVNMKTGKPISSDFVIEVNGALSTNAIINKGVGTYEVKIALGEKNTLTASAKKYFGILTDVDLTGKTENVAITKELQMMPLNVGEKILLSHIFFETASTKLRHDSYTDINRVIDLLRAVPSLKIEISGYTDSVGKEAYNQGISNSRAQSVAEYILAQNISKDRVTHKGYGEKSPVATNLTPDGRAKNRRVEFIVLEVE